MGVDSQNQGNQLTVTRKQQLKQFWVDVFAMNSFSYATAVVIELGIAQMSLQEHFKVRLAALLLNSLVARPFGIWRDYVLARFNIDTETSPFYQKYLADTLIFLSFQMPLYVGNMLLGGAPTEAIVKAALTVSLIAGLLGRPYGLYLDWLKKKMGCL